MDYVLNIYNGNEFMFAVGGKHMNYHNVIWCELEKLISVVTVEELRNMIKRK